MSTTFSYNLIVAGLGGQGVNTLTRTIFELAAAAGRPCQGAVFKGGAQRAGTIHAELKIYGAGGDHVHASNQIRDGSLHLMLGLEPHEALRFTRFFSDRTAFVIHDAPVPFHAERRTASPPRDPVTELGRRFASVVARDFAGMARERHGDARLAGLCMLGAAAELDGFPLPREGIRAAIGERRYPSRTTSRQPERR
jgi:indolepyruvate ferredoxin oxidoreductase, beta subunit